MLYLSQATAKTRELFWDERQFHIQDVNNHSHNSNFSNFLDYSQPPHYAKPLNFFVWTVLHKLT